MADQLARRLEQIVRASPRLMRVLTISRELALPDWMIASGAIYQTVWNTLTRRPADYGVKDFDLFYFDASDLSYDAEDVIIRRAAAAFPAELRPLVEVRNQARVHLWFEGKFAEPYAPLRSSAEALTRFVSRANAVGVRLEADGRLHIEAAFGLEDTFAMRLRTPPGRAPSPSFQRITAEMRTRWPEAAVG